MKLLALSKRSKTYPSIFTEVDDDIYDYLNQWNWTAVKYKHIIYAQRVHTDKNGHQTVIMLHRFIMGLSIGDGKMIDHKDRNGLNNQKSNLRIVTPTQNNWNTRSHVGSKSIYVGVYKDKNNREKWHSRISCNGIRYYLGLYDTEIEAANAYNLASQRLRGEYSNLINIIPNKQNESGLHS